MTQLHDQTASSALYERANRVLPGGVSRNTVLRRPHPLYASHASGCTITDVEGVERVDFANNMTSLIHGHAHPAIVAAVAEQLKRGTAYTMATEVEVDFAEHVCSRSPAFEQLRFVNSGTEAVMGSLKAARAFTGRPKIAKVEGTYHGSYDFAEVSQMAGPDTWGSLDAPVSVPVAHGTPQSVLDNVVVLPFDDVQRSIDILNRHAGEIACVLLDVMPHRAGLIPADRDFVSALSDWAVSDGALVVCDEVITFRTTYAGAQQRYGLTPDITAMGKIIGGGFPVGAIVGRRDVMDLMNPHGDNYLLPYSGTFSANPVTMTAGLTAMSLLDNDEVERINGLGRLARDELKSMIGDRGYDASVTGAGSLFRIHMQADAPTNYRDSFPTPVDGKRLLDFFDAMLDRGVLMIYSGTGAISTPMGESEIELLIA
ncbi:MAG: aspartate aminotransferase family protein, partial [Actinobacteria bacterium]|nr:aspartate aminotransferase family protein [Actinomycetota bacterium]